MKKELPVIVIQVAILIGCAVNIANFSLQVSRYLKDSPRVEPAVIELHEVKQ